MGGVLNWIWDTVNEEWVKLAGTAGGAMSIHAIVEELNDVEDVNVAAPADGEALVWDGVAGEWVAAPPDPAAHAASHQVGGADILYVPRTYVWFVPGEVAVGTEQGPTFRMKRATTIEDVELHVKTAPTGAALIVDINEAGATVFTTKPEIDDGDTVEDGNHVFSDTALAAAAELTMDIDQVGSTTPGEDLTVLLHCKEPVI